MPADKPAEKGSGCPKMRLWAVLFWLLVWEGTSRIIGQEIILVSPARVLARLFELCGTAEFRQAAFSSLCRITLGFLAGVLLGTVLAALSARFPRVEEFLAPPMLAVRAVPVVSFIILALILFSSRNLAVLISFLMVLPILYSNVLGGLRARSRELDEMAEIFRVPPARRFRYITLPQVFPYFESACAAAVGMSWKSGIAAEVIGIPDGSIGEKLQQAKVYFETPDLFAWTLVIVLLSLLFERLFGLLLRGIRHWTERMPS